MGPGQNVSNQSVQENMMGRLYPSHAHRPILIVLATYGGRVINHTLTVNTTAARLKIYAPYKAATATGEC
ncbi:MAG: hypothetical protein Kow0031_08160 [Anaerolineae bacterium]